MLPDEIWVVRKGEKQHRGSSSISLPKTNPWAGKMLYGANNTHFSQLAAAVGPEKLPVRRFYDGTWPSSPSSRMIEDWNAGRIPWVSFSGPTPAQINSGSHDATLISFFQSCTKQCLITYVHEVDSGPKYPVADYLPAATRIWNLKQQYCPNPEIVLMGTIVTGWLFTQGSGSNYSQWFNSSCDFIGVDPYRFWRPPYSPDLVTPSPPDPKSGSLGTKRSMSYLLTYLPAFAQSLGKPIAVAETSAHPDPAAPNDRPAWLSDTDAWLRANNCIVVCLFNGPWGESGPWFWDRFHTFSPNEGDPERLNGAVDQNSIDMVKLVAKDRI